MTFSSRRTFVRGALGAAGALTLTSTVGASLLDAGTALATPASTSLGGAMPDPTRYRVGWNVYDYEAIDPEQIAGIARLRPTTIRWFVSWDRYVNRDVRTRDWTDFRPFFSALATYGVRLQITFLVMEAFWLGDLAWTGGASWAKPGLLQNYPEFVDASYGRFVRSVISEVFNSGVSDVSVGAFNEPDLLWGDPNNTTNYGDEWMMFTRPGHAFWSGGAGDRYDQLFRVLDTLAPNITWNTAGIASTEPARRRTWTSATAKQRNMRELDLHLYYYDTLRTLVRDTAHALAEWDAAAGRKMPYWVGEANILPAAPSALDAAVSEKMREMHLVHSLIWPDRYQGMMTLAPRPWTAQTAWWNGSYPTVDSEQLALYLIDNLPMGSPSDSPAPSTTTPPTTAAPTTVPPTTVPPTTLPQAPEVVPARRRRRRRPGPLGR